MRCASPRYALRGWSEAALQSPLLSAVLAVVDALAR